MNLTKTKEDIIRDNQYLIDKEFVLKCMDDAVSLDKEKRWNEMDYFLRYLVDNEDFKDDFLRFLEELKDKKL